MDTRFDADTLAQACDRLNEVKEEIRQAKGLTPGSGTTLIERFGWDLDSINELTISEMEEVWAAAAEFGDTDEPTKVMWSFMDGLLLGAICADVSWEKSFGLRDAA